MKKTTFLLVLISSSWSLVMHPRMVRKTWENMLFEWKHLTYLFLGAAPSKKETKEEPKSEESKPEEPKKEEPKKEEPKPAAAAPAPTSSAPVTEELNKVYGNRTESRVKMNRMRLRIAERLKQSQDTAASLTTFNEIDMTNLMSLRAEYKDAIVKKHGVKFGFMSAFVKASAAALEEIPAVNASIDGNEIVYHDFVDLSVAVSTPKGLVTPVLRNVEDMGLLDIEKNIAELGKKVSIYI
jgi:2-oxoglutarate dehydrogenase E2 component (dihydrolipoamide succinyltransferase)